MGATSAKKGSGMVGNFRKAMMTILLLGIAYGILQTFNWDFIAIVDWGWTKVVEIITSIGDFFASKEGFQRVFSKP